MSHAKQAVKNRSRYIDWLVQAKCGPDLMAHKLFPNGKEVTESMACFEAVKHLDPGFELNRDVEVFVVGDGHRPRTAATFAFRSAWRAWSIDPLLAPVWYDIKRLHLERKRIEDVSFLDSGKPRVIVMPHSHAPLAATLESIPGERRALITMDCCVTQVVPGKAPDVEYLDEDVWSPKRLVRVWRQV